MSTITQTQVTSPTPEMMRKAAKAVKRKKQAANVVISIIRWIFLLGMCFVVLFPLFQKVMISFMSVEDMYDASVSYIPKNWTLSNYWNLDGTNAWDGLGGFETFANTFVLTLICSLLQVICATLVGYGLARFKFKGNGVVFLFVIIAMLLPPDLLFASRFSMFSNLDLIGDTMIPMFCFAATCTGLKCSLYIFLMRQFFKGQPKELEEAAYVDGAGPFRTFISIMLPGAFAMMVTVFLFSFVWQWLDTSYTSVFCANIKLISTQYGNLTQHGGMGAQLAGNAAVGSSLISNAGVVMMILPLVVLYIFGQRYFVESISRSGLVG